ncbi:MAG: phage baseplate assembly protein V [Marmoricola sp.]
MNQMFGVYVGLVKDLNDPQKEGRVRLTYPWLADDAASGWAPIARPMAGKDRGYFYMPEIDDEALVAFESGSIDHPFIVGFLHNGIDLPPYDGIDEHVRRLRTVAGHFLEFDDRAGQESLRLSTHSGHELEMRDPDGTVDLVTSGGQKIQMQDAPGRIKLSTATGTTITVNDLPSEIELKTVAGVTVTISDTGGVTVTSMTGGVSVNSLTASVTAAASMDVNAPALTLTAPLLTVNSALASFTGVVQCSALLTQAVVSSAYTPGAGNLL